MTPPQVGTAPVVTILPTTVADSTTAGGDDPAMPQFLRDIRDIGDTG